jgi:xanthine dehydrogenase accessory factor
MRHELLSHLLEARREKRPVALVTDLESGAQCLLDGETRRGDLAPGEAALAGLRERIAQDASGILPDTRLFVQVFNPPLRLVIIGAVHIAQALVPAARLVGYEVVVVDPRRAWATTTRFPEVDLVIEWPDDALAGLTLDHRTAVVTLTHDPKLDDPALIVAARSPVFFIGALGSTRTHAKRLDRLREEGLSEAELARINGPVGLPIGARSPAEIAIAVMAQITGALHRVPPLVKAVAA